VKRSRTAKALAAVVLGVFVALLVAFLLRRRDASASRSDSPVAVVPPPVAVGNGSPQTASPPPTAAPPPINVLPGEHYPLKRGEGPEQAVESRMAPISARFRAERSGATPCERAFNGFTAYVEADENGRNTTFSMPPREEFLRRCGRLSDQEQLCMSAAYEVAHRDVCQPLFKALSPKVFDPAPN
jgi:hypothetical protein